MMKGSDGKIEIMKERQKSRNNDRKIENTEIRQDKSMKKIFWK